jgi:hypothetical protein
MLLLEVGHTKQTAPVAAALDLYSGGTKFESGPGYRIFQTET